MNKKILISFLLTIILFSSCENEEVLYPEIAFKEQIVIQSEMHPFETFPGVRITKTLPVGSIFNITEAEVKTAVVYIRINNIQIVPLHYVSEGLYKPLYDFNVEQRQKYELFGEFEDKTFYSKTIIPSKPIVISTTYNNIDHYVQAELNTFTDEVYSALWVVNTGNLKTEENYFNVFKAENNSIANIHVRTGEYPEIYQSATYNGSRYIQVCSFDKSFDNYFKTFGSTSTINNPYVQGSGVTIWNVQGNDVIGMFIGVAKGDIIWVN